MKTIMLVAIVVLMITVVIQKVMITALSLYIKDAVQELDKQVIAKYSENAVKKIFHIPS